MKPPKGSAWRPWLLAHLAAEGIVVLTILVWWLASQSLPDFILPGPWSVASQTLSFFTDPDYLHHVLISSARVVLAVILAVLLGASLAFLPRWLPISEVIVHQRIQPVLNSFPSVGWAILAVIWFGPSNGTIVFIMVMILTPFCLINVAEGLKELDAELLEMAQSFSRRRSAVLFKVTLPLLMPYFASAIRIAYGVGWKIALVAELFGAESGMGFVLQQAQGVADANTVFAVCLAIVLIFWVGEKVVIEPFARRFSHQRH